LHSSKAALQQAEIPKTKKQKSQLAAAAIMHTQKPPSQRLHRVIAAQTDTNTPTYNANNIRLMQDLLSTPQNCHI